MKIKNNRLFLGVNATPAPRVRSTPTTGVRSTPTPTTTTVSPRLTSRLSPEEPKENTTTILQEVPSALTVGQKNYWVISNVFYIIIFIDYSDPYLELIKIQGTQFDSS